MIAMSETKPIRPSMTASGKMRVYAFGSPPRVWVGEAEGAVRKIMPDTIINLHDYKGNKAQAFASDLLFDRI